MNAPILSMHMWASLTTDQRQRVRLLFDIPRSSFFIVNDGRIETDGTTNEDFKHLTTEKMQIYLNDESTDFHKLFDKVLARIQDEIEGKPLEVKIETNVKAKKSNKKN